MYLLTGAFHSGFDGPVYPCLYNDYCCSTRCES